MRILEPLRIGTMEVRNRIVMPPMATGKTADGAPGEELYGYYRQRARGTGLIIVEHEYILWQGKAHAGQLSMVDDSLIPAYRRLTDAIHGEGAKVIAQLNHAGAKAADTGLPAIGPSAVAFQNGNVPEEMTQEKIREVIEGFAAAAVRAKKAGFDGVEIHSAHGYLLNQFYSPLTNRRTDAYGVKRMEDRVRIHTEVLHAVRAAAGEGYTVAIRLGACDFLPGGSEIRDIPDAVRALEAAGAGLIDISGGLTGFTRPGHTEPGYLKDLGLAAKTAASVPVLLTGGVRTGQDAEELLLEGACDLVGVGRALMKDPDWTIKALDQ